MTREKYLEYKYKNHKKPVNNTILTVNEMIKLMNKIGEVEVRYSSFTERYYVVLEGFNFIGNYRWRAIKGILHHEETKVDAIIAFFNDLIDSDEIVTGITSLDRFETAKNIKIYKFVENDFIDITKERIKDRSTNETNKYFDFRPYK